MQKRIILVSVLVVLFTAIGVEVIAPVSAQTLKLITEKGDETYPWLGVRLWSLDRETREELGIKERRGAVVEEVIEGSPAEEAGILEDDVIISISDRKVRDADDVVRLIEKNEPGDEVNVKIVRKDEHKDIKVTLGERPEKAEKALYFAGPDKHFSVYIDGDGASLGVQLQDLNSALAEYFSAKEHEGVLITEVYEESAAEEAGLRPGDIILAIGEEDVSEVEDVMDILVEQEKGDEIEVSYLRKGKKDKATVKLLGLDEESLHWYIPDGSVRKWKGFRSPRTFRFKSMPHRDLFIELDDDFGEELEDDLTREKIILRKDVDIDELREEIKKLKDELKELREKVEK